jgi:phosphopantetheinyl transferase
LHVGNDVVDLRAAENQPAAIHPRFDERVFSPREHELLDRCPDGDHGEARHALRWTLWAARESTLKLLRKSEPELPFHPSEFQVTLSADRRSASVSYARTVTHVRFDSDAERIHAVATARPADSVAAGTGRIDASASPAVVSSRVRRLAAVAVDRLLRGVQQGAAADEPGGGRVEISAGEARGKRARIPRARRNGATLPVDVSLSHDGSWLAHAVVRTGATVLALLAGVVGCSDGTGPDRELERAEARWNAQGMERYTYVFDQSCFCGFTGPVQLTVHDGDVVAAVSLPDSSDPDTPQDPTWFPTIAELFDRLRSAARADAVVFLVTYDADLGFPATASVDVSRQIADEEYAFEVRDVLPAE